MNHTLRNPRRFGSKQAILLLVKLLFSLLLVWLVLHRVDLGAIRLRLEGADWRWFAASVPVYFLQIAVLARRWQLLAGPMLTYTLAWKYTWIGIFYGNVLPGGLTGDVAKGASLALKEQGTRVLRLPMSILIDRVVGFWGLLLIFSLSTAGLAGSGVLYAKPAMQSSAVIGTALAGFAFVTGALVIAVRRLRCAVPAILRHRWLEPLTRRQPGLPAAAEDILHHPGNLVHAAMLSLLSHALSVVLYFLLFRTVGLHLDPYPTAALYSITSVIVMIPLSISGIGVRDWTTLLFVEAVGESGSAGVAFAWISIASGFLYAAFGALVQLWEIFVARRSPQTPRDAPTAL